MKTVIKALLVSGFSLFSIALPSSAQTGSENALKYKYELNLSFGIEPGLAYSANEFPKRQSYYYDAELSDFYEIYTDVLNFTPLFSADFNVNIKKWLKAGVSAGYARLWGDLYDPRMNKKIGEKSLNDFSLMGQALFTYLHRPVLSMYAGVGAGVGSWTGKDSGASFSKIVPEYEIIPLGFQWTWNRFFLNYEVGIGSRMMGCTFGLGCRF